MWAEPWSPMPSPAVPTSPRTASGTSATPRAAGPAGRSSTRTGSASSGGRPSSSTPRPASASTTRSASASRARTPSAPWLPPPGCTCSTPTASPSPRSTSPRPPATRPGSSWASRSAWSAGPRSCSIASALPLAADRVPPQRRDHALPVVRRRPPARPQPLGQHHRRAARPQVSRAVHRPHDRDRRPRAALHALDHDRRRRRRGHPRRPVRLDVLRNRRARGPGLAPHLPRPDQRDAHLLVRRPARRGHRGSRGLARLQSRVLARRTASTSVASSRGCGPGARSSNGAATTSTSSSGTEDTWLREGAWSATRGDLPLNVALPIGVGIDRSPDGELGAVAVAQRQGDRVVVRAQVFAPEAATGIGQAEAMRVAPPRRSATSYPLAQTRDEKTKRALAGTRLRVRPPGLRRVGRDARAGRPDHGRRAR